MALNGGDLHALLKGNEGSSVAEVQCQKIRLDDETAGEAIQWFRDLGGRADEFVGLMRREGVHIESAFIEQTPDGHYLYFYMRADSCQRATEVFRQDESPIAAELQSLIKRSWAEVTRLDLLVDLEAPSKDA